jgi:hypothetical protein
MIERIVILSLVTLGICCPFWDGMIFDKIGDELKRFLGEFWAKPLFACYVCATFWWGLIQCLVYGWPWYLCLPAMGFSAVISLLQKD